MKTKIPEKLYKITGGFETWKHYGIGARDFSWEKYTTLDLSTLTDRRLTRLAEMIEPHSKIKGARAMIRDIGIWRRLVGGDTGVKPRSVEHFSVVLKAYLQGVPGHRIYWRDEIGGVHYAHYVNSIEYKPPREEREYRTPPSVTVRLLYQEFGERCSTSIDFHAEDCLHLTAQEALNSQGYYVETPELREEYEAEIRRYDAIAPNIGLQLLGRGLASDNLDGNKSARSWWSRQIHLAHAGEPARLVVDVYQETDEHHSRGGGNRTSLDLYFWKREIIALATSDEEGHMPEAEEDEDEYTYRTTRRRKDLPEEDTFDERPNPEIPIHPILATFDLRRHLRLRVHVGACEVYEYDRSLAAKLVLPPEVRDLIEILISSASDFKDVVEGKSNGSVILCAGPAGVGKTLTAEVYSEAMERPLYSVQCSQLGVKPEKLEEELHRVFSRAQRWNAIALLDEADVYVMARGEDLQQNAIVGVFLRVLEYYSGTLFLTTNRSDKVDDAIASRCIARIDYEIPSPEDQRRLWRILADTAEVGIADTVIEGILKTPGLDNLSGRDIKNLIKLARAVSQAKGEPITVEMVAFVKRFKPTTGTHGPKPRRRS